MFRCSRRLHNASELSWGGFCGHVQWETPSSLTVAGRLRLFSIIYSICPELWWGWHLNLCFQVYPERRESEGIQALGVRDLEGHLDLQVRPEELNQLKGPVQHQCSNDTNCSQWLILSINFCLCCVPTAVQPLLTPFFRTGSKMFQIFQKRSLKRDPVCFGPALLPVKSLFPKKTKRFGAWI